MKHMTEEQQQELKKCMESPAYFFGKYAKIQRPVPYMRNGRLSPYTVDIMRQNKMLRECLKRKKAPRKILVAEPIRKEF